MVGKFWTRSRTRAWWCCVALLFLVGASTDGCLREERRALLLIRESLNSPGGSALPDWVGNNCCSWSGVACDEFSSPPRVFQILINDTRGEEQGGWYPDATLFARFKALQELELSGTQFRAWVMPQGLGELTSLEMLTMKRNKLTDQSIASWISNLTSLVQIDLSNNELSSSSFLSGICEMPLLRTLDLSGNEIQGSVSPCLGNLSSITHIYLSKNRFSGKIPFSMFANLSQLTVLDLSSNHKLQVETESPSWSPSFQLWQLYLGNCILNGGSGGMIPSFLSSQQSLSRLDLANSSLMGEIPSFLLYNGSSFDALRLKQNELVGKFPLPRRNVTSNLRFLDISKNNISTSLFKDFGSYFPNMRHLNMSENSLRGTIPPSLGQITALRVLDLSYNNFTGKMPDTLTRNNSLMFLILSNNRLQGELLPKSSSMPQLKLLDLHSNLFAGMMPKSLLNSPSLRLLDVRHNSLRDVVPSWLYNLGELVAIFLGRNSFQGSIPVEFCRLQNLHILDLSHNLLSGDIPHCLNNITALKKTFRLELRIPEEGTKTFERSYIAFEFTTKGLSHSYKGAPFSLMTGMDLSVNRLSGNIPDEIRDLVELRSLNLSDNLLTGPFPPSFQKLIKLESLDLSHNELVGIIPPGIAKISSLAAFSVAYNNLSGCIPTTGQFDTFNDTSYEGNPRLLGEQLGRNCTSVDSPLQPQTEGEQKEGDDHVRITDRRWIFHLFIGVSYAIGVWAVFVTLIFKEKWRKAYFDVVDSHLDACVKRSMGYFQSRN